ncbi:hypothetical protein M3910_000279 [Vibrio metschnikovii]|nr:hypothetical protein [Vibrio metschnikovii]
MTKQWCYSFDNKNFSNGTFNTKKAALENAHKEGIARNNEEDSNNIKLIYVAECESPLNERMFPDADIIIEHMACQAEDIGGEYANDYPDVSQEQEDDLTHQLHELLNDWCKKCDVSPLFFSVSESKKYDLNTLNLVK